jgi:hypothetical protein
MARSKASESYRLSRVEKLIETKTEEIRTALSRLGRKMKDGDDSELLYWVIPHALACSQRPLILAVTSVLGWRDQEDARAAVTSASVTNVAGTGRALWRSVASPSLVSAPSRSCDMLILAKW